MRTIGCVSYLNARPLIDGVDGADGIRVVADVPSRLLDGLLAGATDAALLPVIDFQTSPAPLCILPVGAIGSDGMTLTVRVFARQSFDRVRKVAVDGDSRTSAALLEVVFHSLYGARPELVPLTGSDPADLPDPVDAVLLIGDKVVSAAPGLPHQLDLGRAWKELTSMPFVFAAWMALPSSDLGDLPGVLASRRATNLRRIPELATRHGPAAGWPRELAEQYLGRLLRYDLGQRELKAITTFWQRCRDLGLIDHVRPLSLYGRLEE
jgi:chorismate dehydratase